MLAILGGLKAQQLPIYSQYMLNDFCMNPAITGTKPYFDLNSDSRFQWLGIPGAPRTYLLALDGPITTEHIGVGGYAYTDITGPTRQTGFTSSCAYHVKLNENLNLSLGLSVGVLQFAIDGQDISTVQSNDLALQANFLSIVVPTYAAGLYLYSDKFYIGASAPQIIQQNAKITPLAVGQDQLVRHYYGSAGYSFDLGNNFELDPCVEANFVYPTPPQIDIAARLFYQKKFWIGGGFRTMDAAYAMIGYVYQDNITFGFSYDYAVTDINKYSIGTTELYLGIKFKKTKGSVAPKTE